MSIRTEALYGGDMTKTHKCDACGGGGLVKYGRFTDGVGSGLCPVCLGAGSFSDQMPARDAMADAATFRAYLLEGVTPGMVRGAYGFGEKHAAYYAIFGTYGLDARGEGCDTAKSFFALPFPHATASLRASDAFRAVPGLRS